MGNPAWGPPQLSTFGTSIRYYLSIDDGECGVERDLGVLLKFDTAHYNGDIELSDDLLLLRDDMTVRIDTVHGELAVGSGERLG